MTETSYITVVCMSIAISVAMDLIQKAVKRKENT